MAGVIGSWIALWQRLSTSWICQLTGALVISDHSTRICSIRPKMSSRAAQKMTAPQLRIDAEAQTTRRTGQRL